ncbi:MAG TPA: secretin N-terminal domain-containing protein, partial [Vicinamibacteria bacterium]
LMIAAVFAAPAPVASEAKVTLDAKDAPVTDILSVLAEVGRFQVVFDPAPPCALTLKLREVRWRTVLEEALRACKLAHEESGGVLRIAPVERLKAEAQNQRKLGEERAQSGAPTVAAFRLSYARAAEMAPIVKRLLSPRGDVVYDARTNTLFIVD